MRRALILIAALTLLVLPRIVLAQGQEHALIVAAGERVAGDVATVTRDIRVDGQVDGDVTSWSGAIRVAGSVRGDVVSYSGPIVVTASGRVGGHVLASGGALRLEPGAVIAGQVIRSEGGGALASLLDLFSPSAGVSAVGPLGRTLFGAGVGVLLLAFCLLLIALWPRRIQIASTALWSLPARALALGLLTTLVAGLALLPLSALLVASVVGLPLLLALLALALAPYIYGLAVLAHAAAARPGRSPALGGTTIGAALLLVLLIVAVMAWTPLWGLALFYALASPGLGAVILSRGGLRLPLAAQ